MKKSIFVATAIALLSGCAGNFNNQEICSAPASNIDSGTEVETVFGIAIGQPLNFPECPKVGSGSSISYKFTDETCWLRIKNLDSCSVPNDGWVQVKFPIMSLPVWTKSSVVSARIVSGKVEAVKLDTRGIKYQDSAIKDLISKYGAPTSSRNLQMQNGYGAQFSAVDAIWKLPKITVMHIGTFGKIDQGQVAIETRIGTQAIDADGSMFLKHKMPL